MKILILNSCIFLKLVNGLAWYCEDVPPIRLARWANGFAITAQRQLLWKAFTFGAFISRLMGIVGGFASALAGSSTIWLHRRRA